LSQELGYNPPCFFWIAEYTDGTCLPQFDPEDGHENMFHQVNKERLRSFGWYPFTPELASKIKDTVVRVEPLLPCYRVVLKPGMRLIAHKQQHVKPLGGRWTFYMLGFRQFQEGYEGGSTFTMKIDEAGNVEMT
jgi:hypothetical protein